METVEMPITATVVTERHRLNALPNAFGLLHGLRFERAVYAFADSLCPSYNGGFWEFVNASNGAFFMYPNEEQVFVCENGFKGTLSSEASGIAISLYVLSALSFDAKSSRFADCYHALRDYAFQHAEAELIMQACD